MLKITTQDEAWSPKFYGVVVGLFCGLYVLTNAIGPKIFEFHGLFLPASIIIFPLCCIITDLLTEVYGFNRTRQAIWTALACTILFALFTKFAILLPPAPFWPHQSAFESIFQTSARYAIAGCLAWLAGEFANSYVMSKMKVLQNAKHMGFRFIASTVAGQLLDTTVVIIVAFAGTMPWNKLFLMILSGWLFKILYEVLALPLSIPIANWVKKLEGVEHFDRQELRFV